jgi:phage-related protein
VKICERKLAALVLDTFFDSDITGVEHRVFYVAKHEEAVYVVHAFEKRTRQTRQADIDVARKRCADLPRLRALK